MKKLFLLALVVALVFTVSCNRTISTGKIDSEVDDNSVNENIYDQPNFVDGEGLSPDSDKNLPEDVENVDKPKEIDNDLGESTEDISKDNNSEDSDSEDKDIEETKQDDTTGIVENDTSDDHTGGYNTSLDYKMLEKLDNTRLSWWFKMNIEAGTSEVPQNIRSMIDKYDGYYIADTAEKVIYLTFDEGYENGYTASILDTLKANDVKSLFFVTESYVRNNPELITRMIDEGHELGNHTITHPSLPGISYEKLEKEIKGFGDDFYSEYGVEFRYLRTPSGEYSERVLAAAQQLNYKTIFWSYAYRDWDVNDQKGTDYAYNSVINNLHNGAVYLLHAVSKDNTQALDSIIKEIRERGYEIRPVDF